MKPVKPKPLPKYLRRWIESCASERGNTLSVTLGPAKCYAILAALEYAKPAPLYQCRRKCALLFTHEHERDVHEADCG